MAALTVITHPVLSHSFPEMTPSVSLFSSTMPTCGSWIQGAMFSLFDCTFLFCHLKNVYRVSILCQAYASAKMHMTLFSHLVVGEKWQNPHHHPVSHVYVSYKTASNQQALRSLILHGTLGAKSLDFLLSQSYYLFQAHSGFLGTHSWACSQVRTSWLESRDPGLAGSASLRDNPTR